MSPPGYASFTLGLHARKQGALGSERGNQRAKYMYIAITQAHGGLSGAATRTIREPAGSARKIAQLIGYLREIHVVHN